MADTIFGQHISPKLHEQMIVTFKMIGRECHDIFGSYFVALVLGGSYGTGDGAVIFIDGNEKLSHDIDLFVISKKYDKSRLKRFSTVLKKYQHILNTTIDIHPIILEKNIASCKAELCYWDLFHGYVVLSGDQAIFERNQPKWILSQPLTQEASRLLLFHGSKLLEAKRIILGIDTERDSEILRRICFGCEISLGDALLIAFSRYSSNHEMKISNVLELCANDEYLKSLNISDLYVHAMNCKIKPNASLRKKPDVKEIDDLIWKWGAIFLYIEKKRLSGSWKNLEEYCNDTGRHEHNIYGFLGLIKNIVYSIHQGDFTFAHPRESFYIKTPILLGLTSTRLDKAEWAIATENALSQYKNWK